MTNPLPTLMVVNFKGTSNVSVHKLLNGTTLDPTQDGNDVLTGTLETPTSSQNAQANRLVEFLGKRFLLHGHRVYERDNGGAGNWGVVTGTSGFSATDSFHSGLHVLYPAGVPTLAYLMKEDASNIRAVFSINGTSFSSTLFSYNWSSNITGSVAFQDSIFTAASGTNKIVEYNFSTNIASNYSISGTDTTTCFHVHRNDLYASNGGDFLAAAVYRKDSGVFTNIYAPSRDGPTSPLAVPMMLSDGNDIIWAFCDRNSPYLCLRLSNTALGEGGVIATTITSTALSGITDTKSVKFFSYTSVDPDPTDIATYFWASNGGSGFNVGNFDCYRFNYRRITHGAVTNGPYIRAEFVEQAVTGARGQIMTVGAGSLDLSFVSGTFDNSNIITGDDSGASAAATSLLVEQVNTFIGAGQAATNFGLPQINSGGADRIPVADSARPSFEGIPVEVVGNETKWFFRVYGTGAALSFRVYIDDNGVSIPTNLAAISGIVVESGTPATTPAISGGNQIDNLTPDSGVALYSVKVGVDASGISSGTRYSILMDTI
jgi:hypothetical protein